MHVEVMLRAPERASEPVVGFENLPCDCRPPTSSCSTPQTKREAAGVVYAAKGADADLVGSPSRSAAAAEDTADEQLAAEEEEEQASEGVHSACQPCAEPSCAAAHVRAASNTIADASPQPAGGIISAADKYRMNQQVGQEVAPLHYQPADGCIHAESAQPASPERADAPSGAVPPAVLPAHAHALQLPRPASAAFRICLPGMPAIMLKGSSLPCTALANAAQPAAEQPAHQRGSHREPLTDTGADAASAHYAPSASASAGRSVWPHHSSELAPLVRHSCISIVAIARNRGHADQWKWLDTTATDEDAFHAGWCTCKVCLINLLPRGGAMAQVNAFPRSNDINPLRFYQHVQQQGPVEHAQAQAQHPSHACASDARPPQPPGSAALQTSLAAGLAAAISQQGPVLSAAALTSRSLVRHSSDESCQTVPATAPLALPSSAMHNTAEQVPALIHQPGTESHHNSAQIGWQQALPVQQHMPESSTDADNSGLHRTSQNVTGSASAQGEAAQPAAAAALASMDASQQTGLPGGEKGQGKKGRGQQAGQQLPVPARLSAAQQQSCMRAVASLVRLPARSAPARATADAQAATAAGEWQASRHSKLSQHFSSCGRSYVPSACSCGSVARQKYLHGLTV